MDGQLHGAADPTIIQTEAGDYYIVCTGRGAPIWHSENLLHWRNVGRVFDEPAPRWARAAVPGATNIWAPDVTHFDGLYHVYYSVSTFGSQRSVIGLAVNKTLDPASPDYAWVDRGLVIESAPGVTNFNAIDAALFMDVDDQPWLFWGSFWTGLYCVRIDRATGKPLEGDAYIHVAARGRGTTAIEAPFVIRHADYYYLFVSWDDCCSRERSTYNVRVGRSQSIAGPYVDAQGRKMTEGGGTLVLANHERWCGPGHNSVLQTPEQDWLVHHTYDLDHLQRNRVLQIRPMYWSETGWPIVGQPLTQELLDARKGPAPTTAVGRWRHSVDYGDATAIDLLADGTIRGSRGQRGEWSLDGTRLTFTWSPSADGTVFVDQLRLEPTGDSYIGRNQRGHVIRGVK